MVTGGTNPEMKARIKKERKGLLNFCKKGANSPATPKLSLQHSYKLKYFFDLYRVSLAYDFKQISCYNAISLRLKMLGLCNTTIFQVKQRYELQLSFMWFPNLFHVIKRWES